MRNILSGFVWFAVLVLAAVMYFPKQDQALLPPTETSLVESPSSEGSELCSIPGTFSAKVLNVYDGDTFTVKYRGDEEKIRLAGIDAPELDQQYGKESRETLIQLLGTEAVQIRRLGTDRYGRNIAEVTAGSVNVNENMVISGAAWFYSDYSNGMDFKEDQINASKAKRGLWQAPGVIPPWLYRKLCSAGSFGHSAIEDGLYLDRSGVLHNSRCTNIYNSRKRWNGVDEYTNCPRCGGAIFD